MPMPKAMTNIRSAILKSRAQDWLGSWTNCTSPASRERARAHGVRCHRLPPPHPRGRLARRPDGMGGGIQQEPHRPRPRNRAAFLDAAFFPFTRCLLRGAYRDGTPRSTSPPAKLEPATTWLWRGLRAIARLGRLRRHPPGERGACPYRSVPQRQPDAAAKSLADLEEESAKACSRRVILELHNPRDHVKPYLAIGQSLLERPHLFFADWSSPDAKFA